MKNKVFWFCVFSLIVVFGVFAEYTSAEKTEKAKNTVALLLKLSGDTSIWSGGTGLNIIARANTKMYNDAERKGPSEASFLYMAVKNLINGKSEKEILALMGKDGNAGGYSMYTGTYIDAILIMEFGISPEIMVAIINEVIKTKPVDSYAFHFAEQLNIPQNAAESLAKIARTQGDFLANPQF